MAKSKSSKSKVDFKQILIAKGEYIAMGGAGLMLALLLMWGASRWAGAKDHDAEKISKELTTKAQSIQSAITNPNVEITEEMLGEAKLPEWLTKRYEYRRAPAGHFSVTGPLFDPIAKPDTKKENPMVLPIGTYQVNLVRAGMEGYDILFDKQDPDKSTIAVIVSKKFDTQDKEKIKDLAKLVKGRAHRGQMAVGNLNNGSQPGRPGMGGGTGMGPPGAGMGPPGAGMGMGGMSDGMGSEYGRGGFNPYGGSSSGYNSTAQRVEKLLDYIPLRELDKALDKGKVPARTVVPLRMVTIHAEVPYKKQVEEIKRALRLPDAEVAKLWGPIYDGYEVQRRVTRVAADGSLEVYEDWPDPSSNVTYNFEDKYAEKINSRKFGDSFEDGYLAHFIRYDMALALPLPKLMPELGSYPDITLVHIKETIKKLQDLSRPQITQSELLKRLGGRPPRSDLYTPQTGQSTGADIFNGSKSNDPGLMPPAGGTGTGAAIGPASGNYPRPGDKSNQEAAPPVEIEHLLLRFIDADVEPGFTYEYRIRLRMLNPNHGLTKEVANPAYALPKELYSPWAQILPPEPITIPVESFLFARDPAEYRKKIDEEYAKEKELKDRLQARPDQAVVEMCRWYEDIRTDGGKHEPVGAWVVADIPVSRGQYIGRKQYIKLPLWSSESNQYTLREVAEKVLTSKKDVQQPKGWLMDFTTKSLLVDFEGGRVVTRSAAGKTVTEDVAAEMLIVLPDGRLMVKNSLIDEANPDRKKLAADNEKWVKEVEKRPTTAGGGGDDNPFNRKD